jgi:hypothetical protein
MMTNHQWIETMNMVERKIVIRIILGLITILFVLFISANLKKLKYFVSFRASLADIPPAVNLKIVKDEHPQFEKSFPYNKDNIYIMNRFDITRPLEKDGMVITLNRERFQAFRVYQFKNYNIVRLKKSYVIFTVYNCGIKEFLQMRNSRGSIITSLSKLVLDMGKAAEKERICRLFDSSEETIDHKKGESIVSLPVKFRKNHIYEFVFDYKVKGSVKPVFLLDEGIAGKPPVFYNVLEPTQNGQDRRASIVFWRSSDLLSPTLHLSARFKTKHKGTVSFNNISIYEYKYKYKSKSQSKHFTEPCGSQVTYLDFVQNIRNNFIGIKYYNYH